MTPKYVFEEIKEYIPRGKTIWMPFYGDGKAGQHMKELGFDVIHQPEDFWSYDRGDIVVDNPPFEKKKEKFCRNSSTSIPLALNIST